MVAEGDGPDLEPTEFGHSDDVGTIDEEDSRIPTIDEEPGESLEVPFSQQIAGLLDEADDLERHGVPSEDLHVFERAEQAAEALVSLRDARRQIQDNRRDRQYHGRPRATSAAPGGQNVEAQKSQSSRWDCGKTGHWAGDAACPRPGAGLFRPARGESKGGGRGRGGPSGTSAGRCEVRGFRSSRGRAARTARPDV